MKKILALTVAVSTNLYMLSVQAQTVKLVNTGSEDSIIGIKNNDLRSGNVDLNSIPFAIVSVIKVLIALAGTIAIFSLIYNAVKMQINSGVTGDSSGVEGAKKGMIASVIGFVIAILAWFIVTNAVELLSNV